MIIIPRLPNLGHGWPDDYVVYMDGARLVRMGLNPHELLPYWYPLPVVLFTTMPWSFLPYQFSWAFATIPLGLLHLRYGRYAPLWWIFLPLLINVIYGQMEGWLILPLFWLLEDRPVKNGLAIITLMFKPAYGMFLVPYRLWGWWQARRFHDLGWLLGFAGLSMGAAFLVEPAWPVQWFNGVINRHENTALIANDMTIWAFGRQQGAWLLLLPLTIGLLCYFAWYLWHRHETRGELLLAFSIVFFPGGLNPVSSMMVMPLLRTRNEIVIMVVASWGLTYARSQLAGPATLYLLLVVLALALRLRRLGQPAATEYAGDG